VQLAAIISGEADICVCNDELDEDKLDDSTVNADPTKDGRSTPKGFSTVLAG